MQTEDGAVLVVRQWGVRTRMPWVNKTTPVHLVLV